jgi:hypothetical protein
MTGAVPEMVRLGEGAEAGESTRDLRGYRVFDRAGVEVGVVEGLLVDARERRTRLLRIVPYDPLEVETARVLVPVEAIDRLETDRLFLDALRERILSVPPDDPAAPMTPDRWAGLYAFFDVEPYWTIDGEER